MMKHLSKQTSLPSSYSSLKPKKRSLPVGRPATLSHRILLVLLGALIASSIFLLQPYLRPPPTTSATLLTSRHHFPRPHLPIQTQTHTQTRLSGGAKRIPVGLKRPSKRVVVTGGAGFVGSHLVDRLLERGDSVIVIDNFFTGRKDNLVHHFGDPRFELIRHDVVEPILLEVDQIYHLACPASPVHYKYNPIKTIKTNVMGTLNMLGLAKRIGARFLLTSTSEVYGDPLEHPQKETYWGHVNPIGVRSCYDEGKRTAETLTMDYHRGADVEQLRQRATKFLSKTRISEELAVFNELSYMATFQ